MFHYDRNSKILGWLTQELRNQIPDFEPYGKDRRLLVFAYQDLEICLRVRWKVNGTHELRKRLLKAVENRSEEVKAFLKIWSGQWLWKWRERIRFYQRMPKFSKRHLERLRKNKEMYKRMEKSARNELKTLAVQKLVNQGEVCMIVLIAETLILKEIAHQMERYRGKASVEKYELNPAKIFQGLLTRIKTLAGRKIPLIYLKMLDEFN